MGFSRGLSSQVNSKSRAHNCLRPRGSETLFWPLKTLLCMQYTLTETQIPTGIIFISFETVLIQDISSAPRKAAILTSMFPLLQAMSRTAKPATLQTARARDMGRMPPFTTNLTPSSCPCSTWLYLWQASCSMVWLCGSSSTLGIKPASYFISKT